MLNLKVYINNIYESLELPEDFTISIQYNSGIWNFESIPGSYSIPFELINTIQNNRLLSYPHNLSNIIQSKRRLIAQLWVNDLLLHAGILEVEETTNQNFKCVFKFDTGAFASEFKDILLTDCELGGEQNWIWKNDYNNSNSDFALSQIKNNSFLVGSGFRTEPFPEEESFFINWYSTYNDKYYFEVFKIFPGYSVLPIPVVPFPYLFKIIQYLFNSIGYNLKSNFFSSTDDLKKLLIYNINDAEQSTTHFDLQFNTQRVDYILDTLI